MQGGFFPYVWRHSRQEQLIVLFLVLASLPFYWVSLDIPKRIVNEAIQGKAFKNGAEYVLAFDIKLSLPDFLGGLSLTLSDGVLLKQLPYLFALSGVFLALTLVNGAFKYVINVRKGILGERMLRRLRFELFTLVMRFRPEAVRATKSAEISSMIKDEVEPIGGFFGEAFITPAFLGAQAFTALLFIMAQSLMLGLLAGAVIGVQGVIIPKLRKEQLRLGRKRQIASRKLAGRVSEMVDAAPMLHGHALVPHFGAEIGDRLSHLFTIRMDLFRRKFMVKFLNNLLAQATPFIFYTLGGYLALKGQLDIGQLVAVIAAYRDLPTPIKELIDWDQERADAIIKFDQVTQAFTRELLPPEADMHPDAPPADAPFQITGLRVVSPRGILQLDQLSLTLERPAHIALVGPQGSARDILPKVLGRQTTDFSGSVALGGVPIGDFGDQAASRSLLYVGADPFVMSGSIRDNICLVARQAPPPPFGAGQRDGEPARLRDEAERTGNPPFSGEDDWIDYTRLGISGPADLDRAVIGALKAVRGYDSVFEAGLAGEVGPYVSEDIQRRILDARRAIAGRLDSRDLAGLVEPFDQRRFNTMATIGENLLFGRARGGRFNLNTIAKDPFVRGLLDAESLTEPLTRIGTRIVETVVDIIGELPAGSPLLDRYSFIAGVEREELIELLRQTRRSALRGIPAKARDQLLTYSLLYIEPRHRLKLLDEALMARILRARVSFRLYLTAKASTEIEFYDRDTVMQSAPIRENLLFGRIGYGLQGSRRKVDGEISAALRAHDLEPFVIGQGLAQEAGPGGRLLTPEQRAMIPLARAALMRPDTLILDNALGNFAPDRQNEIITSLRSALDGRTLIVTLLDEHAAQGFDRVLTFAGAKLTADERADSAAARAA